MTIVPSQVRAIHQTIESAFGLCPACGRRPEISGRDLFEYDAYELVARCHGSTERLTIERTFSLQSMDACARAVWPWATSLFKLDAMPDVRELLHYNRGTLPNG